MTSLIYDNKSPSRKKNGISDIKKLFRGWGKAIIVCVTRYVICARKKNLIFTLLFSTIAFEKYIYHLKLSKRIFHFCKNTQFFLHMRFILKISAGCLFRINVKKTEKLHHFSNDYPMIPKT